MSRTLTIHDDVEFELGDILVTPKGRRFHVTDHFVEGQTRGLYVKSFTPKLAFGYALDDEDWGWPCWVERGRLDGQYLLVIESEFLRVVAPAAGPDLSRFPHKCPKCGSPAYVGFSSTECSREDC